MSGEKILVVGAGVAGSVLAFWLAKGGYHVTVAERSPVSQKKGQGVEIDDKASVDVVTMMGVLDELKRVRTGEKGFDLMDEKDSCWARFDSGGFSPTGSLEIMRGDLTEVLYKVANKLDNVTYLFETTVRALRQTPDKAIVDLEDRKTKSRWTEEFDFVIGADGVKSHTRNLAMGSPEELDCYKPVGAFVAYFAIPKEEHDWPRSRLCHFPGRRILWTRPISEHSKLTSVNLIYCEGKAPALHEAIAAGDRPKQKQALMDLYSGLGWESSRIMSQMSEAENFYADELNQVKLKTWAKNRVALVGDAAWAPTPFTGQGNSLAIIGAWVLAQELSRNRSTVAFEMYEKRFKSHVEGAQSIPLWGYAPFIFNPQTTWAIAIIRGILWMLSLIARFVVWTKIPSPLPEKGSGEGLQTFDLQVQSSSGGMI